jgi:hypothetical protein
MELPSYKEILGFRNLPGEELAERFSNMTSQRFDTSTGLPVLVTSYNSIDDTALTILALARSTTVLAPYIVNSAPTDSNQTSCLATAMGAKVIEVSNKGQTLALKTGITAIAMERPGAPIVINDDDCLPQRRSPELMARSVQLATSTGAIAFGGVVLEHGPSKATDVFRTAYALGGNLYRWSIRSMPRARPNAALQLDSSNRVLNSILEQADITFPCDMSMRDSVVRVGGRVISVMDPRAIICTRGNRFSNMRELIQDLWVGNAQRVNRYPEIENPHIHTS